MAKPSARPKADVKFTRRKLGEKLYLQSSEFDLQDPNCNFRKPTYHSLHDPYLKEHFHHKELHKHLKEKQFITEDDMVICTHKEFKSYLDYVEDIKSDVKTKNMRERQRKILQLKEQGLISEDVSLEDIRMFLQAKEFPTHDECHQHEMRHPKKSTKETIKEKNLLLNDRPFPNITTQPECPRDRARLRLIEQEIKHEFNRNKYLRDIQEKRSRREKIILERRAEIQQAEKEKMMKTLSDLDKMRVKNEGQTKQNVFCESTSVKASLKKKPRPTRVQLAPLPARGHDLNNQQTSSSGTEQSMPSDKSHKKKRKEKPSTKQHNPRSRIIQAVPNSTMSTVSQNPTETIAEAISAPTVKREGFAREPLEHIKPFGFVNETKKIGENISSPTTILSTNNASSYSCNMAILQPDKGCGLVSLKESQVSRTQISLDEVEMLAGASSAPSSVSTSDIKDEEGRSFISQVAEPSAPEISPKKIESLADASAALSGACYTSCRKTVSQSEALGSLLLKEFQNSTPMMCSDEVEMLAGVSNAPSAASASSSVIEIKHNGGGSDRTLRATEMTLMNGIRSSASSFITEDIIEDVVSMLYMDPESTFPSRSAMPIPKVGGGTLLSDVAKQSISMPSTSKACSTESLEDNNDLLTLGPLQYLFSRITEEILDILSATCFKEGLIQSVKNDVRQRVSGFRQDYMLPIEDIMEVTVKSTYHKIALLISKRDSESLIVENDIPELALKELPALGSEDSLSPQELASIVKKITVAVLNHLKIKLCDQIQQQHNSQVESELVTNAVNNTLGAMIECASNIQFFKEELYRYISRTSQIPTQKLVGELNSLSKLDFVSTWLALSVIDKLYDSESLSTSSSKASSELDANSPLLESMAPSKPASPSNNRSFRARKWLSSPALEKSANTDPINAMHSKSLPCFIRTDMQYENEDQLESSSSGPMSMSSSIGSLKETRSSPLPKRLVHSRSFMNLKDMLMGSTLQPKPPHKTRKTLGRKSVKILTVFRDPEFFSGEESGCSSCSLPEEIESDDESAPEEDPSCSPKRHSM